MTDYLNDDQRKLIEDVRKAYESGHTTLAAAIQSLTAARIGPILAVKGLGFTAGTAINALVRATPVRTTAE